MQMAEFENGYLSNEYASVDFIRDVESRLDYQIYYSQEIERHRAYWKSLGGIPITQMPLPDQTSVFTQGWNPLQKASMAQPVDPNRPFTKTTINKYKIAEIMSRNPRYPAFWEEVQTDGIVENAIYSQHIIPIQDDEGSVVYIGSQAVPIPKEIVELRPDNTTRIYMLPPKSILFKWPEVAASDCFAFTEVPRELIRAANVYFNACNTRAMPYFFDVDSSHLNYKAHTTPKRIAIEYNLDTPNQMRPVFVKK